MSSDANRAAPGKSDSITEQDSATSNSHGSAELVTGGGCEHIDGWYVSIEVANFGDALEIGAELMSEGWHVLVHAPGI